MTGARQDAIARLARATGYGKPMRWADRQTTLGDYEGREYTIQVFNIPPESQRQFFRELRSLRDQLEAELGHPISFVFHTPEATAAHYSHLFPELSGADIVGHLQILLSPAGAGEIQTVVGVLSIPMLEAA